MTPQPWQLAGQGPEAYERYLVPAFFAGCAGQLLDLAAVGPGERVLDVLTRQTGLCSATIPIHDGCRRAGGEKKPMPRALRA